MYQIRDRDARGRYQWLCAWAWIGGVALRIGRKGVRQLAGSRPAPAYQPRVARAEYRRMCGWIAYRSPMRRRYFADGAWGGYEAAEAAARAWLAGQEPRNVR